MLFYTRCHYVAVGKITVILAPTRKLEEQLQFESLLCNCITSLSNFFFSFCTGLTSKCHLFNITLRIKWLLWVYSWRSTQIHQMFDFFMLKGSKVPKFKLKNNFHWLFFLKEKAPFLFQTFTACPALLFTSKIAPVAEITEEKTRLIPKTSFNLVAFSVQKCWQHVIISKKEKHSKFQNENASSSLRLYLCHGFRWPSVDHASNYWKDVQQRSFHSLWQENLHMNCLQTMELWLRGVWKSIVWKICQNSCIQPVHSHITLGHK